MKQMNRAPLRSQAASYDPANGRAAPSSLPAGGQKSYSLDGEPCRPWAPAAVGELAKGSRTWAEIDKSRTQGGDVRKRPVG